MNYAEARRLSDGSGWHFTVRNDSNIWTHQCCCGEGPPATEEDVIKYGYRLGEPTLGPPHAPHATKEEADACCEAWQMRQADAWQESNFGDWGGCEYEGCDNPTKHGANWRGLGGRVYVRLCDEHLNDDGVQSCAIRFLTTMAIYS